MKRTPIAMGVLLLLVAVWDVRAQEGLPEEATDSAVLAHMKMVQDEFELYRESRTPVKQRSRGSCDERIGRICIWFGGANEEDFPAERREVGQAREDFIRELVDALERVPDPWILGQLVHYLVENRTYSEAERHSNECVIEEEWWCRALLGYTLHVQTRFVEAESAFREALRFMPDDLWYEWTTPRYIMTPAGAEAFNELSPARRDMAFEVYWKLSDPLFLFDGNDRLTDHFARLVEARNGQDARDPVMGEWDSDVEEALVRYGRNTGYSRTHDPAQAVFGGALDTRMMQGHHHPKSRGYLFPEEFLESPSEIPAETWITAPREARTWYAPPYAPDVYALETQVGRFRRDDQMLVVGAYRPTFEIDGEVVGAWSPEGGLEGQPHAALFLIPEDDPAPIYVRGNEPEGVLTIKAWPGQFVSGLEVVDLEGRQAWRARQGVVQVPLVHGLVGVSDLMILKEDAPLPETFDEAVPLVRPGVRLRQGERFGVIWEVYGLAVQEPVRVTIGFSPGRPGFLQRIGDFLGIIEPEESIDITFDDTGPDMVQTAFRAVQLELPDLDDGEYTLHLRLEVPGREPVVTSRPILVVE